MSDCPYTGKTLLEKRKLPLLPPTLDKIWELSDQNKDGFLDKQDFLVAYQLIEKSKRGEALPDQVANSFVILSIITNLIISSFPLIYEERQSLSRRLHC